MTTCDHTSFNAKFNSEHGPGNPADESLLKSIVTHLTEYGFRSVSDYKTDYSRGCIGKLDGSHFFIELGPVGDPNAEWLLYFGPKFRFFGFSRLFFREKIKNLAKLIHQALQDLDMVDTVRWYRNKNDWNLYSANKYFNTPNA